MKNSNHASKALAVVLSGALAFAPAANAALDESNMAYTSAAEGFYGSLRVQYANNDAAKGVANDATVEAEGSRLGVRGDIDIGGGLGAFYGFEWNLGGPANGDTDLNTRQHHVGLKGDWGSIWLGAFDSVIVRFGGFSTTDILDQYSGNFEPIYRTSNAVAYVSPDLNGFQFGVEIAAQDGTKDIAVPLATPLTLKVAGTNGREEQNRVCDPAAANAALAIAALRTEVVPEFEIDGTTSIDNAGEAQSECSGNSTKVSVGDDGNDFDKIGVGASYSIQGLTFSGAYYQEQDALGTGRRIGDDLYEKSADKSQYALGVSFSQDNWIVAAMYGLDQFSSPTSCARVTGVTNGVNSCEAGGNRRVYTEGDAPFFSLAAGVSIDKLDIHGLWEQKSYEGYELNDTLGGLTDDEITALGGEPNPRFTAPAGDNPSVDNVAFVKQDRDVTITAITARYHLGSKARLRAGWKNTKDETGNTSTDQTSYALGMRVDF